MKKLFTQRRERGRVIQNLRVVVDYRSKPSAVQVSRSTPNGVDTYQWLDDLGDDADYVDSEALREAFFAVKDADQAEEFLRSCGPFRKDALGITWEKFQDWQVYFKSQRRLGAAGKGWGSPPEYSKEHPETLDRIVRVPKFEPLTTRDGQPVLAARADSAVEVIAAANFLERWAQTVLLTCRQCGDPFAPKTKASLFCKHSCAHTYWRANGRCSERKGGARAKTVK